MPTARQRRTPEERRAKNRERQRQWYERQHHPSPSRRAKRVLVTVCEKLEAYLYAVQAVDRPSGNDREHIGEGIERLLKISMKNS